MRTAFGVVLSIQMVMLAEFRCIELVELIRESLVELFLTLPNVDFEVEVEVEVIGSGVVVEFVNCYENIELFVVVE
jgi:hypothetical protein